MERVFKRLYGCSIIYVTEDTQLLRSLTSYETATFDGNEGLSGKCIFHKIPNYNILDQVIFDPMHDLNEGVCRYVMGFLLDLFINVEKRFTLDFFNAKLAGINYIGHYNATPALTEDQVKTGYLIISSSEMIFLLEYFGLLVGDRVPKKNKAWELFLLLKDIVYIVYGVSFDDNILNKLDEKITQHHKLYLKLSQRNLTIKFHNLLHFRRFIERMGPPRFFTSIRYEGRHNDFKEYSDVTNNYMNSPYSLAAQNVSLHARR